MCRGHLQLGYRIVAMHRMPERHVFVCERIKFELRLLRCRDICDAPRVNDLLRLRRRLIFKRFCVGLHHLCCWDVRHRRCRNCVSGLRSWHIFFGWTMHLVRCGQVRLLDGFVWLQSLWQRQFFNCYWRDWFSELQLMLGWAIFDAAWRFGELQPLRWRYLLHGSGL
jgi:hypothetical protein